MASPIRANRLNFVGYRRSTNLDLVSDGVVTGSNTRVVYRENGDGTWSSYVPGDSINGFTTMTRARNGTSESASNGSGNVYLLDALSNFSIEDMVPIATVLEGSPSTPSNNPVDTTYVHIINVNPSASPTPQFDRIPNFALRSGTTVISVQNGNWSSGSTWAGGSVPASGTNVRVFHSVTVDDERGEDYQCVSAENGGTIAFSASVSTQLRVREMLVRENGTLTMGTPASPIPNGTTCKLIIRNVALDTTASSSNFDPNQYGNGLIVLGTFTACGYDRGLRYYRSTHERSAGATTITLNTTPTTWQNNDSLYIPDTRSPLFTTFATYTTQTPWVAAANWEYRTIASRSGATITLSSALSYDHIGGRNDAGTLTHYWHVFNRTSNVTIESENPTGTRGHTLYTSHARIDVRNVCYLNMGRTNGDPLNNTTYNSSGVPTSIGTNQIGRYPAHFHHCGGREMISYDGGSYTFLFLNNVIDGGILEHQNKWGCTVHGSHWGLVRNNFCHNTFGGGFVAEDGSETNNWFDSNASCRIPGRGALETGDDSDNGFARNGVGFWMRTGLSRWTNNVANACFTYGWAVSAIQLGTVTLPIYPGQHVHDGSLSGGISAIGNRQGLWDFNGFEVYGFQGSAGTLWWVGAVDTNPDFSSHRSVVQSCTAWNIVQFGIYLYPVCNVAVDDYTMRYNTAALATGDGVFASGVYGGDYMNESLIVSNCDITGPFFGLEQTSFAQGNMQFLNNTVRAVQNIKITSPGSPGSAPVGTSMKQRVCYLEGNDFATTSASYTGTAYEVYHFYSSHVGLGNTVVQHDVFYERNGTEYQLFSSPWQRPAQICPENSGAQVGCPESGLTNQQAHDKYQQYDPDVGASTPVKPDNPNPNTPGLCLFGTLTPASYTNPSWTNADVVAI